MKIIVSGGGTGGHIYPALTIADTIKKLYPEAEIRFVGTTHGLEKDLVPRAGYPIDFIDVQGFRRSLGVDTFRSVYKLRACRISGGYAGNPVLRSGTERPAGRDQ